MDMDIVIIDMGKIGIIIKTIIIIPAEEIMVIKATKQDQVLKTRIPENVPIIIIIIIIPADEIIPKGVKVIIKIGLKGLLKIPG